MTVQELIDSLQQVQDKEILVVAIYVPATEVYIEDDKLIISG